MPQAEDRHVSPEQDVVFLRNVVHGAPVRELALAARLQVIDERLNSEQPPSRRMRPKPESYYRALARRLVSA